MPPVTADVTVHCTWAVCIFVCVFVCVSVTLVHPAKTIERNEMPFGRIIRVIPSNIVLDRGPSSPKGRGDLGVETPSQFTVMPPITKLLWPLLVIKSVNELFVECFDAADSAGDRHSSRGLITRKSYDYLTM